MIGWHFLNADLCLAYPPHTEVELGVPIYAKERPLRVGRYGLHAAERAVDALHCDPRRTRGRGLGAYACRVRLGGKIRTGPPERGEPEWMIVSLVCASERTVLAWADATELLEEFARWCARQVLHLWDAPKVVRKFLKTGNESLMDTAWTAAGDAAWNAPSNTVWAASVATQCAATRATAWAAAWAAAEEAAWRAAWAAAGAAHRDATWDADRFASRGAVAAAAWAAAREQQNGELERRLHALLGTEPEVTA